MDSSLWISAKVNEQLQQCPALSLGRCFLQSSLLHVTRSSSNIVGNILDLILPARPLIAAARDLTSSLLISATKQFGSESPFGAGSDNAPIFPREAFQHRVI